MTDKPKYYMPISPMTGKRTRMTEEGAREWVEFANEYLGGTVTLNTVNRIRTAEALLKALDEKRAVKA